jgi:hypothetical protein
MTLADGLEGMRMWPGRAERCLMLFGTPELHCRWRQRAGRIRKFCSLCIDHSVEEVGHGRTLNLASGLAITQSRRVADRNEFLPYRKRQKRTMASHLVRSQDAA